MTNREAAEKLARQKSLLCHGCVHPSMVGWCEEHCQLPKAFDMAINALKAQELANNSPELDNNFGDLISRQAVIEINRSYHGQMPNEVNHRIWKEINELPSAQPETHGKRTETHSCDCISRQDAIDAMEDVDWYHIGKDGQLVHGANSKEDEPLYKAEDVYKVLEQLPSAQPEIIHCGECKHRDPEDHKCDCGHDIIWQLPRDDKWYCADAERRTDGV